MRTYHAFYKGRKVELQAESLIAARDEAARRLKARKAYEVAIVLADAPVSPNALPGA